jgi:hypothetical protein
MSPRIAIAGAVVVVLLAGTALYLVARSLGQHSSASAATPPPKAKPTAAATPSPTASVSLGPYGYIASRRDDPQPLTVAQLYPASFTAGGVTFVLASSKLSGDCIDAVSGAGIQAAVSAGNCSQVARATYLDSQGGMMGTIGVLNLQAARFALSAAKAAGAANYISQLPGRTSPTSKIGQGTGIEEAYAKGHYLILMWAELTSLKTPRTTAAKAGLAQFMTDMLQDTANVSLTNRMVDGNPSPAPPGA